MMQIMNVGAMLHRAERPDFNSSHYDQPNILGHLRLNDRNINGKRILWLKKFNRTGIKMVVKRIYNNQSTSKIG